MRKEENISLSRLFYCFEALDRICYFGLVISWRGIQLVPKVAVFIILFKMKILAEKR